MPANPARLYQQLQNTGVQNKDTPMYQFLRNLIDSVQSQFVASRTTSSSSVVVPVSGALVRQNASFTTGNIGVGGTELGSFNITGGWKSAELLKITSDRKCYLVLYATEAARDADSRVLPALVDPTAGIGILLDAAFSATIVSIDVSPPVVLYNIESPAAVTFYYRLYNAELTLGMTQIDLTYVGFE